MRKCFAVALVVLGLVVVPDKARAQTALRPGRFALAPADFPQPAEILRSRVEDNSQATADQLVRPGSETLAAEGRITGYYMEAEQPNIDADGSPHPVVTTFLVSIFAAPQRADQAFQQQRAGWDALVRQAPAVAKQRDASGTHVGDGGQHALYSTVTSPGVGSQALSELFFRTGPVLVEIW